MNLIKKVAIGATAFAGIATMGGIAITQAAPIPGGHMSGLVAAIAQKFNLKPADVQQVFDQQSLQQHKDRLDQAVKDGKLTQVQADALAVKQAELKTKMEELAGKTPAERQAALKTTMDEFATWAKSQAIPQEFAMMGRGMGRGEGFGGGPRDPAQNLIQAVKDGKLTQAQADLITAKQTEIKAFRETLKSMSEADRQTAMRAQREALTAWAKANNLPEMFGSLGQGGPGAHMGQGGRRGGMMRANR